MDNNEFNEFNGPPQDLPRGNHRPDPEGDDGSSFVPSSRSSRPSRRDPDDMGSRVGMSIGGNRTQWGGHRPGGLERPTGGANLREIPPNRVSNVHEGGGAEESFPGSDKGAGDDSKEKAEFVGMMKQSFVDALKEALGGTAEKVKTEPFKGEWPHDKIETSGGLAINVDGARSVKDMERSRRVISRYERGEGSAKEKLIERLCVKLSHQFGVTNYGQLLSHDSDFDVAKMTLDHQEVIKSFTKFATKIDALDIFKLPNIPLAAYSNIRTVMGATSFTNILTSYQDVELDIVKRHQRFINLECDPVEAESSDMCKEVLEKSTQPILKTQVDQLFENLPKEEQGGVTYFKLIMDVAYKTSFQSMQGLLEWMKGFDVRKYDGEDVAVAVSHFKAVLKALGAHAPPDPVRTLLKGLSHASNKEFEKLCDSQLGILDSVLYQRQRLADKTTPVQEVDEFGSVVVARFTSMNQSMEWSGISHKGSVYRASLVSPDSNQAFVVDKSKGKLPFKEYWDNSICELPGCGGKHPTRYHNNLEARNQSYRERNPRPNSENRAEKHGGKSNQHRSQRDRRDKRVTFKSDEAKSKFKSELRQAKHKVHQAIMDNVVEEDQKLFANIAGDDGDEGFESAVEEIEGSEAEEDEVEAWAHATISIDALLNW
jgi:hypothetical protein